MQVYIWLGFIFLMSVLGSLVIYLIKKDISLLVISIMSGVSAGIMLAATIWSLLIPSLNYENSVFITPICFLVGGVIIMIIEALISKTMDKTLEYQDKLFWAVTIHNIPEGLIVGMGFGVALGASEISSAISLALAIGIQNLPESLAMSMALRNKVKNQNKLLLIGIISGIVEPMFGLIGFHLVSSLSSIVPLVLGFSGGMMMYVVLSEMVPEAIQKNKNMGILGLMLGFVLMMVFEIIL